MWVFFVYYIFAYVVCSSNGWRRVFVISLFVEHIQLGIEAEDKKLKSVTMEHSQNLGKVKIYIGFCSLSLGG